MKDALGSLQDVDVELANEEKLCGLDYADDLVFKPMEDIQHALERFSRAEIPFRMWFEHSMCNALLQDWVTSGSKITAR